MVYLDQIVVVLELALLLEELVLVADKEKVLYQEYLVL
jgi:hypothetical protein